MLTECDDIFKTIINGELSFSNIAHMEISIIFDIQSLSIKTFCNDFKNGW